MLAYINSLKTSGTVRGAEEFYHKCLLGTMASGCAVDGIRPSLEATSNSRGSVTDESIKKYNHRDAVAMRFRGLGGRVLAQKNAGLFREKRR